MTTGGQIQTAMVSSIEPTKRKMTRDEESARAQHHDGDKFIFIVAYSKKKKNKIYRRIFDSHYISSRVDCAEGNNNNKRRIDNL